MRCGAIFIIIAGFTQADSANFKPFLPNDQPDQWKQIFNGASIAFFSFIGFDAVATAAEEVVNPSKNMPIGILASMSIVTVIYFLMCVVLCLMVPRNMISADATFAVAFEYVGLGWAKHIVAIGAILGILTSTMMGIYAPARILAGCTREGMLPPFMARNYVPGGYKVPFYPFIPCGSLFVNTFLLGQLDVRSYKRFGWWTLAVALIYFLYGIFAAQNKDDHETLPVLTDADVDPSHPSIKAIEDSPAAAPAAADEDRRGEVYMVKMD
ncbi:Cationic amino acid transporter 1 [Tetrabaena socialis]|uniref:Cationic amino acid transporter 1 n=1 Tax=Tetrabaena socialis TaxID=47790 RepID=A0A2J7ZL22_9CHLO|nr:Cationic amino acid transporter 1 [Tetrabaena socialis]|eukprot:PNH00966.1 Cationic amino acid transporter 1 [Tetrabaena socialis]